MALTPRHWLLSARLSDGVVVRGQNRSGYGGRGVYLDGDRIEPEFEHLTRFLPDEGVFVDVGASTGLFALKAAKHFRNRGLVLALEPVPEVLAVFAQNVAANGLTNVRYRGVCAADFTGPAAMYMNKGQPASYSIKMHNEGTPSFSVLTVTLDDLARWEGIDRLDYLKIDTMGSEEEILEGGRETIQRFRPIIQAEVIKEEFSLPEGYAPYAIDGSPNILMFPEGHEKIAVALGLEWKQVELGPEIFKHL